MEPAERPRPRLRLDRRPRRGGGAGLATPLRPVPSVAATSDCEHCREGWINQPANTLSSLAYVVAGTHLAARAARAARPRPPRRSGRVRATEPGGDPILDGAYAAAVVAVGVGSVAYHGPGGAWGRWLHDAALVTLAGVIAVGDLTAVRGPSTATTRALVAAPVVASLAASPPTSEVAQLIGGGVAVAADLARYRSTGEGPARWALIASVPCWLVGAACQVLGRTGGPWCRPDTRIQPHAIWHVCSAAGLWLRAQRGS